MQSLKRAATLAVLVAAACTADSMSPTAPTGPHETISDAAHAGAVPGFYFLPPMVDNPPFSGTFNASLQPRVEVCELSGAACGAVVATFTFGTGSSSVRVGGDHYIVNWHTGDFDLDPARFYRISVFQDDFRLGYADVDVVGGGNELRNVDTGQFIALLDGRTLPIKFRVETTATPPVANPDTFDAIGNVTIPVDAPGVLANDTDAETPSGMSVVPGTVATASGGTATLAADGSFTYLSAAGFTGTDSFSYTVAKGPLTATALVTMRVPEVVWYVDNSATAPGDGRDVSPFTALVSAQAAAADSQDVLVMYGDGTSNGYDAGYTFKPGQSLYGQGVPDQVAHLNGRDVVVLAAGSTPTVTRTTPGATLRLAFNSDVRGLNVTSTDGPGIEGSNLGTFWAEFVAVAAVGGPSLDLENALLEASFSSLSSANSSENGLRLAQTTGTLTAPAGTVTNAAAIGVVVSGGNSDVAYGGSISGGARAAHVFNRLGGTITLSGSIDNTGTGILVESNGGGAIAFNGSSKSLSTGTAAGVTLLKNGPNATVSFGGGGLVITTTTGTGFRAEEGGTVTVTGAGNTVASAGGMAISVVKTTIGTAGLSFRSVAASGGTNGIVLNSTGAVNGLQVTGSGGPASGGTIQNTSGPGVLLRGVRNVRLSHMVISGADSSGIAGTEVTGFALASSTVSSNGDAPGEAGVSFAALVGTVSVDASVITGSAGDNLRVQTSGTLALRVAGSTISSNGASGGDGVRVEARVLASVAVDVSGNTFSANRGDHFRAHAGGGAHLDVAFTGNVLGGGHPSAQGRGVSIGTLAPGEFTGSVSYDVADNAINGAITDAVRAELGSSSSAAAFTGSVRGNVIGSAGVPLSCSAQGSGISVVARGLGTHTAAVTGNTLRRCLDRGIFSDAGNGAGTLNLTVTGNTVAELVEPSSREGFFLNAGTSDPNSLGAADSHTVCLSLGGAGSLANVLTHGPSASADYRLDQRFATTVRLPGYEEASNDTGAVAAFVSARNGSASGSVQATVPPGGGYVDGAACPQP
jgi:hypothetical protein